MKSQAGKERSINPFSFSYRTDVWKFLENSSKIKLIKVTCNYEWDSLVDCAYLALNFRLEDLWSSVRL